MKACEWVVDTLHLNKIHTFQYIKACRTFAHGFILCVSHFLSPGFHSALFSACLFICLTRVSQAGFLPQTGFHFSADAGRVLVRRAQWPLLPRVSNVPDQCQATATSLGRVSPMSGGRKMGRTDGAMAGLLSAV